MSWHICWSSDCPETLTVDQAPWLELLAANDGIVEKPFEASAASVVRHPFSGAATFVRGLDWEDLLTAGRNSSAEARFHHASMVHARASSSATDMEVVAELYRGALARTPPADAEPAGTSPAGTEPAGTSLSDASRALAHRGLGLALLSLEDTAGGVAELVAACAVEPDNRWLLVEAMTELIAASRPQAALEVVGRAPTSLADVGRVAFLRALAHARSGEPGKAADLLRAGLEVADLREGENSITALWQEVCPNDEVPEAYQFSMR